MDEEVDHNRVQSNYVIGLGPRDYRVHLAVGRTLVATITALKSDGSETGVCQHSPVIEYYETLIT